MADEFTIPFNKDRAVEIVCDRYGLKCLSFILEIDEASVHDYLLEDEKGLAFELFKVCIYCLEPNSDENPIDNLPFLLSFLPEKGPRLWAYLRIVNGSSSVFSGKLDADSEFERELIFRLAWIYPSILLKRNQTEYWLSPEFNLIPLLADMRNELDNPFLDESGLRKLMHDQLGISATPENLNSLIMIFSIPNSTNITPLAIVTYMLYHAVYSASLKSEDYSFMDAEAQLKKAFRNMQSVFKLETVSVPAIVCIEGNFKNVPLPIRLEDGTLRKPSQFEIDHIIPRSDSDQVIFEAKIDLKIEGLGCFVHDEDVEKSPLDDLKWVHGKRLLNNEYSHLLDLVESIRLALMLSAPDNPISSVVRGIYISCPTHSFYNFGFLSASKNAHLPFCQQGVFI